MVLRWRIGNARQGVDKSFLFQGNNTNRLYTLFLTQLSTDGYH